MAKKKQKAPPQEIDSPLRDPETDSAIAADTSFGEPPPRVSIPTVKVPVKERIEIVVYAFPTKSRCPRCGSLDTRAYCTNGKKQHRKCLKAVCREAYKVIGTAV